jgi:hypothetical protein
MPDLDLIKQGEQDRCGRFARSGTYAEWLLTIAYNECKAGL